MVLALGAFAWGVTLDALASGGWSIVRPRPRFAHGGEVTVVHDGSGRRLTLLGCYHVSQQNTFTGRLTPAMLDAVLARAVALSGGVRAR